MKERTRFVRLRRKENPNSVYYVLILTIAREGERVFAGSTDARSPVFPHNCKIDSMARRTTLQLQSTTVSDLSLVTCLAFLLSRLPICTIHVLIYRVIYISISIKKSSLNYSNVCGSFNIQNRCKFVERFFSYGRDRARSLLLHW